MKNFIEFTITDWMQEELQLKGGTLVAYAILYSAGSGEPVHIDSQLYCTFENVFGGNMYKAIERLVFDGYIEPIADVGYKPVRDQKQIRKNKAHWEEVRASIIMEKSLVDRISGMSD